MVAGVVAVAAVAAVVVVETDTGQAQSAATTAEQAARLSLPGFATGQAGHLADSAVTEVDGVPTAVVGVSLAPTDRDDHVLVVAYRQGSWSVEANVALGGPPYYTLFPGQDAAKGSARSDSEVRAAVQIGDVTGDGLPDFLVPLAAQGPIGAVVSDDGGTWRAVPFAAPNDPSVRGIYVGLDPQITGGALSATRLICEPNCSAGNTEPVTWHYQGGVFTSSR